jgi:hypothetical protein
MVAYPEIRLNLLRILSNFNKILKLNSISINLICCIERVSDYNIIYRILQATLFLTISRLSPICITDIDFHIKVSPSFEHFTGSLSEVLTIVQQTSLTSDIVVCCVFIIWQPKILSLAYYRYLLWHD